MTAPYALGRRSICKDHPNRTFPSGDGDPDHYGASTLTWVQEVPGSNRPDQTISKTYISSKTAPRLRLASNWRPNAASPRGHRWAGLRIDAAHHWPFSSMKLARWAAWAPSGTVRRSKTTKPHLCCIQDGPVACPRLGPEHLPKPPQPCSAAMSMGCTHFQLTSIGVYYYHTIWCMFRFLAPKYSTSVASERRGATMETKRVVKALLMDPDHNDIG